VYHHKVLPDFADHTYRIIQSFDEILPAAVKDMLPYMIKGNWLVNYANVEGIHRALSGMAQRTPYESKMDQATADLIENYNEFKKEFDIFFPLLTAHCKAKIEELNQA
jgi:acyl carrier protein phosphodiesterase